MTGWLTRTVIAIISVLILSSVLPFTASAQTVRLEQSFPTVQRIPGTPCNVGGNPDDKLCVSSNQDNAAPLGEPWITAVRYNASANWSLTYGAWSANSSVMAVFSNVRAISVDMNLDVTLHAIINYTEGSGNDFRMNLQANTPYISFTIKHLDMPVAVTWRGASAPFSYDASDNGTLSFTLAFTNGMLVISFPVSTGSTPGMLPMLPGLTNFQQLDVVPNFGQISSFSCDNVTLTDPRPPSEIANTRVWIFNWDDGSPMATTTVPTATHLYGTPGVYRVVMTVQNSDGTATGYAGIVDTTPGSCTFHVARGIVFVVLALSSVALMAVSFRPKLKKTERKSLRRKAVYSLIAVFIVVVVL